MNVEIIHRQLSVSRREYRKSFPASRFAVSILSLPPQTRAECEDEFKLLTQESFLTWSNMVLSSNG